MTTREMFDYLTPTTLAAVVVDLQGQDASRGMAQLARQSLVANVGESEAAELIDAELAR